MIAVQVCARAGEEGVPELRCGVRSPTARGCHLAAVHARRRDTPSTRDQAYWFARAAMVMDINIEPHVPQRVLRQFNYHQTFPTPVYSPVLPAHQG